MEDNYTNQSFRPDDDIVNPQDDLYSIAWGIDFNPSFLYHPKLYRNTVTIERTDIQDFDIHQNNDGTSSQRHNDASDFVNDKPHSNRQLSQDLVNVSKVDVRVDIDAPIESWIG